MESNSDGSTDSEPSETATMALRALQGLAAPPDAHYPATFRGLG